MKLKWYFCLHHGVILEPLTEPKKNRIDYVKKCKPKNEVKLRLFYLREYKGKVPASIVKMRNDLNKAENYFKTAENCFKTRGVCIKARKNYVKAVDGYIKKVNTNPTILKAFKKEFGVKWKGDVFKTFNYD